MEHEILHKILNELVELKSGQSKLEADMTSVKTDLSSVKTELSSVKTDLSSVKTDLSSVKTDLSSVKTDLSSVKEDVAFTKETAMRMELDHGNQLKALWDGYSSIKDTVDEHTVILTRMEHKIDDLDIRVGVHDIKLQASN